MMSSFGATGVVVWECQDLISRQWKAYMPHVSDFIEVESIESLSDFAHSGAVLANTSYNISLHRIDQTLKDVVIDLGQNMQIRGSQTQPIRRSIYPMNSPPAVGVDWQWCGDARKWISYDMEVQCILESAKNNGIMLVDLSQSPCCIPYQVDLVCMCQIRPSTGFKRDVQRSITMKKYTKTAPLLSSQSLSTVSNVNGALQAVHTSSVPQFNGQYRSAPFNMFGGQQPMHHATNGGILLSSQLLSNTLGSTPNPFLIPSSPLPVNGNVSMPGLSAISQSFSAMMVSKSRLKTQVVVITECVICTEPFKEPKVLPCIHTFCLHCLEKYGEDNYPGDKINCPLCRKKFTIPHGGFKDFPTFHLSQSSGNESKEQYVDAVICDWCAEPDEKQHVKMFCIECQQHLCQPCCTMHGKYKSFKGHQVVSLKDKPSIKQLKQMTPSYCKKHPSLIESQRDQLVKTQDDLATSRLSPFDITFTPSPTVTDTNNWAGKLGFKDKVLSAAVFLTHPTIHQVSNKITRARGIAVLASEIFVGGDSTEIDVYDTKTFSFTRQIPIPGLAVAVALVACSHNNCLYVSTYDTKIHRLDLSNNSSSQWTLIGQCCGLSVTKNFNLIATLKDKRIQEYTTQGRLIREIVVNIDSLNHSVQLSSGEFVVCQAGSESKVCIVDSTGQVIKSYGGPAGSSVGQLNYPGQLSVDKSDNVIVADSENNRVVLLSPTLSLLGYIPTSGNKLLDQLVYPWAVHLDTRTGYLFIGEWSGHVFVLKASASRQ